MDRKAIKAKAKEIAFNNKWNIWKLLIVLGLIAACISFILGLIAPTQACETKMLFGSEIEQCTNTAWGYIVSLIETLVTAATGVAAAEYILTLIRTNKVANISDCFKNALKNWKTILIAAILVMLNIGIGMILLIIPGIIATFGLEFFTRVIYDNPELKAKEALRKTWNLMMGHKWEYFVFCLSFIGWILLCALVIPMIWALPFILVAETMYYDELCKLSNK